MDDYGKQYNIHYSPGLVKSRSMDKNGFPEAIEAARKSDIAVVFIGEEAILSGEARSRAFIDLPGEQEDLVREVAKTGKPIVLVIMAGRPLVFNKISPLAKSIIFSFFPGTMGGPAIADVIMGEALPSGKLPVTFPRTVGQIPIYYNHMNTGRPPTEKNRGIPTGTMLDPDGYTSYHMDVDYTPEYAFGYGLTYTSFEYSGLSLSKPTMGLRDSIEVSFDLKNTGMVNGTEVVQLYTRQFAGSITQPVKVLHAFRRQDVKAGDKVNLKFVVHSSDIAIHNDKMELVTEPGKFQLWVGGSSDSGIDTNFEVK
jgi:beta-glucosidase